MADLKPGDGNAESLRQWFLKNPAIAWGTPGDFTRCVAVASQHMSKRQAKGFCANLHHRALGYWPGDKRNK